MIRDTWRRQRGLRGVCKRNQRRRRLDFDKASVAYEIEADRTLASIRPYGLDIVWVVGGHGVRLGTRLQTEGKVSNV